MARLKWLKEGDHNTKFFHYTAHYRRCKNHISLLELCGEEFYLIRRPFLMLFLTFRNLMGKAAPNLDVGIDWKLYYPVESRMPLASLEEAFAKEEIRTAVFSLRVDKARGSGGYNMRFYQHFWQILREYFIDIFQAFYEGHLDISRFNRAYIALVPKIAGARRIGYFRPISLINGIIKIISKVFIGRLKKKINDLIDPSQSAFLMVAQFWIVWLLPKKLFQLAPDTISLTTFLNWTLL